MVIGSARFLRLDWSGAPCEGAESNCKAAVGKRLAKPPWMGGGRYSSPFTVSMELGRKMCSRGLRSFSPTLTQFSPMMQQSIQKR